MDIMINLVIGLVVFSLLFLGFNWLMGYQKGNIIIDLDTRYRTLNKEYIEAIIENLEDRGKTAQYEGNRQFLIDGKRYTFTEKNVSMGGAPLQRTVLKPLKGQNRGRMEELS